MFGFTFQLDTPHMIRIVVILFTMGLKRIGLVLLTCHFVLAVIFRYEPPQGSELNHSQLFEEKPNLVRRRFRNEADLKVSPVPLCQDYNYKKEVCLKCLEGFSLVNNVTCDVDPAFIAAQKQTKLEFMRPQNPNQTNQDTANIILNRNPFCLTTTTDGRICLTCHKGFILEDGQCIEDQDTLSLSQQLYLRPIEVPKNTFCKTFNSLGQCESCFPDSTFNGSQCVMGSKHMMDCRLHQFCLPEVTDCLTYSSEGMCKSCPREALNVNGVCRINKPQSLCQKVNPSGKCDKCSKFGSMTSNQTCVYQSIHCASFNPDLTCNTCVPTYRRVNGDCIRPSKIMFINTDPNCATWKEGSCVQCQYGFGFYQGYCLDLKDITSVGEKSGGTSSRPL